MENYRRVLIKLSGGAFAGKDSFGFSAEAVEHIAQEVLTARDSGLQVAIVVGGGNIFRGNVADRWGIDRVDADNVGMLGTVINSLMLRAALKAKSNYEVRVMSAIPMAAIAEPYIRLRAIHHLERGFIVILAGGIGQPYVTTDYPAVQRSLEIDADTIFVAKHGVDGVYTADPKKDASAQRYKTMNYDDFIRKDLKIMDQSAILLARDYGMKLHIFNFDCPGSISQLCKGEDVGTSVYKEAKTTFV